MRGDVAPSATPRCRAANGVPVGAAEGCDKVGTTFRGLKKATGSVGRDPGAIAAFGSSYESAFS